MGLTVKSIRAYNFYFAFIIAVQSLVLKEKCHIRAKQAGGSCHEQ